MSEKKNTPDIRIVATCEHCGLPLPEGLDGSNMKLTTDEPLSSSPSTKKPEPETSSDDTCSHCGQSKTAFKNRTSKHQTSPGQQSQPESEKGTSSTKQSQAKNKAHSQPFSSQDLNELQAHLDSELPQIYRVLDIHFQNKDFVCALVQDDSLEKSFLLKLFNKPTVDEHTGTTDLVQAELLAGLNHPHLLTIYDTGFTKEGRLYIVMDPPDKSLESIIQEEGFLDIPVAIELFMQYCEAVFALHQLKIVHGSIRPRSFSVTNVGDGVYLGKLTNYGITVSSTDDIKQPTKIGRNYTCMDAYYWSPEECNSLAPQILSEVYSFGCVFFHAITGKPVFRARDLKEAVRQHTEATPARFRRQYEIPDNVQKVVLKMLEKDPADRYQSIEEVRLALIELQTGKKLRRGSIWEKIISKVKSRQNKNRF